MDRACRFPPCISRVVRLLGSVADHIAKLRELESLGVTQFNIYLMHDDMDGTLEAYGHDIIPALHPLAAS